ncbi:MAG: prolipoprotein diacylglyceryl transferase, partial [Chloroflexi bacterium]|nr:prolipoprotein diacylglyceryl transferase [Chloroflexota bacterium]
TQLFHLVWNVIGFAILWALRKRLKPDGSLFLIWLIFFGARDFIIRFFRETEAFLFNLPQAQLLDILIVAAAAVTLAVRFIQYRRVKPAEEAPDINKSGQNPEG